MPSFIDLLQRKLTQIADPVRQKMIATSLIGGLTALFTAYLNGRLAATREQFIDYCVEHAAQQRLADTTSDGGRSATPRG